MRPRAAASHVLETVLRERALDAESDYACNAMMRGGSVHFSQFSGHSPVSGGAPPGRAFQELWFSLARIRWSSVVLVPADPEVSTAKLAVSLAEVGGRLRDAPVTAIVADTVDYESVRFLADLQLRVTEALPPMGAIEVASQTVAGFCVPPAEPVPASDGDEEERVRPAEFPYGPGREARPISPAGKIIVAIPPVVVEPLGVAIAHAADAVVLCVQMGRTRMEGARRTIELIGSDRITGAFLIR